MRILHISGARSWGGNEQQLVYVCENLIKKGVEQHLFGYQDSVISKRLDDKKVQLHLISFTKPYTKDYRTKLNQIIKNAEIDLVHLHTSDSVTGYVITDLFFNLKVKTVFSKKGISRSVSFLSRYKYNYKKIHKIICVSEIVKEHFKTILTKKNHHKLCVVYDGVLKKENDKPNSLKSLRKTLNLADNICMIGNIANHTDAKDLKTLLKSVAYLVKQLKMKNIHLVQIGEFSKRTEELKGLLEELKIESFVSFLNFEKDAVRYMPQFSLFIMTSQREGGPTTIIEAFSQKVPVVSTRVGVVAEAVKEGVNGFVSEVGDYKKLASDMKKLVQNSSLRDEFSTRSYVLYKEKFTAEKLGQETFEVYKELLSI